MSGSFKLTLQGTNVSQKTFSASLNPEQSYYFAKSLGYNPNNSNNGAVSYTGTPGYTYINFKDIQKQAIGTLEGVDTVVDAQGGYSELAKTSIISLTSQSSATVMDFSGSIANAEMYSYASTPMIQSQLQGTPASNLPAEKTTIDLFKFHTLNHGNVTNKDFKVSISNLKEPGDIDGIEQYSRFSVLLRKYGDTDKNQVILEQFDS